MLASWQTNPTKYLAEDGIISPPLSTEALPSYTLRSITSSTRKVDITAIASILKEAIQIAKIATVQQVIEHIDKKVFEYFKRIASVFNKALANETEIPEIIDFLRKNGYVTEKESAKLLDLLLIIDGLKLQSKILDEDVKLLSKIAEELEEVKILYPEDQGSNLPSYYYIEVAHA